MPFLAFDNFASAAGFLELIRSGFFKKGQNIVFIHTGGSAGLFGYVDDIGYGRARQSKAA